MNKSLTHDELQLIEHSNKILKDHLEIVETVVNQTEGLLNNYIPILKAYVQSIVAIRTDLGNEIVNIVQSTRQVALVTNNTQNIINFTQAVSRLNEILTPELISKLNKIAGEK